MAGVVPGEVVAACALLAVATVETDVEGYVKALQTYLASIGDNRTVQAGFEIPPLVSPAIYKPETFIHVRSSQTYPGKGVITYDQFNYPFNEDPKSEPIEPLPDTTRKPAASSNFRCGQQAAGPLVGLP
ncbi:hypothetical protein [Streptacidiphilus sp. PAMC 29251]